MTNIPPFATLNQTCAALGTPNELDFQGLGITFSNRAFDFRAAALADVSDLNQAITEFDCLALLRPYRFVFFRRHSTPTAWTDHNWLFRARPHG